MLSFLAAQVLCILNTFLRLAAVQNQVISVVYQNPDALTHACAGPQNELEKQQHENAS